MADKKARRKQGYHRIPTRYVVGQDEIPPALSRPTLQPCSPRAFTTAAMHCGVDGSYELRIAPSAEQMPACEVDDGSECPVSGVRPAYVRGYESNEQSRRVQHDCPFLLTRLMIPYSRSKHRSQRPEEPARRHQTRSGAPHEFKWSDLTCDGVVNICTLQLLRQEGHSESQHNGVLVENRPDRGFAFTVLLLGFHI